MNNASGIWKFLGIAVLVTVASLAGGYYLSAGSSKTPAPAAPTAEVATDTTSAATPQPQAVRPSSEYTAPDAPTIDIKEVKPQGNAKKPDKSVDSEASQTGVTAAGDDTPKADALIPPQTPADPGVTSPDAPTPSLVAPTPQTPSPPPVADVPGPSTPEPAQPAVSSPATDSPHTDSGPIYHVLVGNTFADAKNAGIFAASLRHRGFMAVTESINSGGGAVYKVQVGAYRNRVTAESEVDQLQQSGYPAYIATDR